MLALDLHVERGEGFRGLRDSDCVLTVIHVQVVRETDFLVSLGASLNAEGNLVSGLGWRKRKRAAGSMDDHIHCVLGANASARWHAIVIGDRDGKAAGYSV